MIMTTGTGIENKRILEYKGIVFGEVIVGINAFKDFGAGLTNFFGGRSVGYEEELKQARANALAEMESQALNLGCNAIIAIDLDYEVLGAQNNMMMICASGTAVVVEE